MINNERDDDPSMAMDVAKNKLKERIHKAASNGQAFCIYTLLGEENETTVKEVLEHLTENDGQKTTPLIMAAILGYNEVVEVLLTNFEVNLEQKSTVKFDGFVIEGATALWCAAGAGHYQVVEVLIRHGADVNCTTASNSTPLRAACFDGWLLIVQYLLEHGADLNIANKYNNTCLMISSYKGHHKVVKYLLKMGADPDVKAHCGATSFHFAADCGHLDVVKELLRHKASMLTNGDGMTPLMVAAEYGREEVVDFLLRNKDFSILENIQAYELLGAAFANDKEFYDISKTFIYLRKAMVLKGEYYRRPGAGGVPKIPPVKAYGYHKESETIQELIMIGGDHNALHMEALTIRERILGLQNPEVPHPIIFRGAVFADTGQFDKCVSLWMHAMVMRQTHSRPISKDLLRLAQVFSQMILMQAELCFEEVEVVLQYGLREIEGYHKGKANGSSGDTKTSSTDLYHNNILTMIYLIAIVFHTDPPPNETLRLNKLVYTLLKLKPEYKNGYSPLHIVVDPTITIDNFHVSSVVAYPCPSLVLLFLECGANFDAVDSFGNTPLHIIASCRIPQFIPTSVPHDIIKILLQCGAHCDIANKKRQTPLMLARGATSSVLRSNCDLTLRCLAARCVRENNIVYKFCIPGSLETFVDCH